MVLALLTLATTLIPSAAIKCAIPIVDLLWKKDGALQMLSVREAMSKIPVERISRVVNEFYQGSIPDNLFDDLKSKVRIHHRHLILSFASISNAMNASFATPLRSSPISLVAACEVQGLPKQPCGPT